MSPGTVLIWLAVALSPYWLGPIVVWLTQRVPAQPVFERFAPERHKVPADVAAALRQTTDELGRAGFHVVADLFQSGQVRRVNMRLALFENRMTTELALAVAAFTTAGSPRLVTSFVELPTKLRDGRSVTVNNSRRLSVFTQPASRDVVQVPTVRDAARLVDIKRAYLAHYSGGAERIPFPHQDDPLRFLGDAMTRELQEQVEAGTWWRDERAGVFRPTFAGAWRMTWRVLPPLSVLRRWRARRRAVAILRDLGVEDQPDSASKWG